MPNNFHYAAYSYLDQWMMKDRKLHSGLAAERDAASSGADGITTLADTATYYGVMRTLKTIDERPRLKAAFDALRTIERPDETGVVAAVENYAETLRAVYGGGTPLSAASKFLWMEFRSPVVVYDSFVSRYLKNCGYEDKGYSDYYRVWLKEYKNRKDQIREACAELKDVKRFTRACDVAEEEFTAWTESEWFMQRVFDHFMLNEPSFALLAGKSAGLHNEELPYAPIPA